MEKIYNIFAGINGAGKSTLYQTQYFDPKIKRINPDEIVEKIGSWKNQSDQITAGKLAVKQINDCIKQGISFNQETTLSGKTALRIIENAKQAGFQINMYYVGVDNAEIAKKRVKERVFKGGHDISEQLIEKRYQETLKNLEKAIPLCDKLDIYSNTRQFALVAHIEQGKVLWKERCSWLEPVLLEYEHKNICSALRDGGYEVTEKLVEDVKMINTYFNKNHTIKEIKELYKKGDMLPEKGKELVKHAASDFIEAEKAIKSEQLRHVKPVNEPFPKL